MTMSRPADKTLDSTPLGALPPLCVDLDGTLLRIDTLHESAFAAAFDDWRILFGLPGWLAEGKAKLTAELASRWRFDPATLPYNTELLEYIIGNGFVSDVLNDWARGFADKILVREFQTSFSSSFWEALRLCRMRPLPPCQLRKVLLLQCAERSFGAVAGHLTPSQCQDRGRSSGEHLVKIRDRPH